MSSPTSNSSRRDSSPPLKAITAGQAAIQTHPMTASYANTAAGSHFANSLTSASSKTTHPKLGHERGLPEHDGATSSFQWRRRSSPTLEAAKAGEELSSFLASLLAANSATGVSILIEITQEPKHSLAEGRKPPYSQETYNDA